MTFNGKRPSRRNIGHSAALAAVVLLAAISPRAGILAQDSRAALEAKEEQAIKQAAALVAPSLVRIETVGGLDRVGQVLTGTGPTTGIIVSPDGFIISSAFNFASRPASILVTLPDGRRLAATQVASDKVKMLTLLKIDAENLPVPQAAPADSFRVGQWAVALGKTLDDVPSVSVGIVSALNRIWGKALQTDAKISPVNYGGALVDIGGRVLGVLVPLSPQASGEVAGVEWYDSGIGFAIPMVEVNAALDRLKAGKDLFPGLMGITIKGRDLYEGQPVIDRVRYGSPAHQAGLKEGDAIVELDGHAVRRQAQIRHVMGNKYAGENITIKVKRDEEELPREMTLVDKLVPYESAFLGVLPVRDGVLKPEPGVGIRYVIPDSPAAGAGLDRGQRILKFNDADVSNPAALLDLVSRLRPGDKAHLAVQAGKEKKEIELTLAAIPEKVPLDLRPSPIVPREKELADKDLKTGRFTDKMPAHEHEFWAYVPEDYNPEFKYGLVVWLHPGGDTMEAAMLKSWRTLCDERGLILLAPKAAQVAGWIPDEVDFVKDTVEMFLEKYSIDRSRVVLHGYGPGGGFACQVAFKHRALFKGISTVAAPLAAPPPDNEPDFRVQFHLISGDNDPLHRGVQATAKGLRDMKYPVVETTMDGAGHKYPAGDYLTEIAIWIDALDRI
ncbi:MAG: PDZ domain-containing protein [Deltaproteobacteria bacterium]